MGSNQKVSRRRWSAQPKMHCGTCRSFKRWSPCGTVISLINKPLTAFWFGLERAQHIYTEICCTFLYKHRYSTPPTSMLIALVLFDRGLSYTTLLSPYLWSHCVSYTSGIHLSKISGNCDWWCIGAHRKLLGKLKAELHSGSHHRGTIVLLWSRCCIYYTPLLFSSLSFRQSTMQMSA